MPIQLYIFDWSGTLSDDRKPVYEANMRVLSAYGKERLTYEAWLSQTALTPVDYFHSKGVLRPPEELFARYKQLYDQVNREGIVPSVYPYATEVLRTLHEQGFPVVILSAHPNKNLQEEIQRYELEQYIDRAIGNAKEKSILLRTICKEYGVAPQFAMYTADTVYDIRAAKEAGVVSSAITHGYHSAERLEKEFPDYVFRELPDVLKFQTGIEKPYDYTLEGAVNRFIER